jgi:hypothetical protein
MEVCRLCQEWTSTKVYRGHGEDVPICAQCGACKCSECVEKAKKEAKDREAKRPFLHPN